MANTDYTYFVGDWKNSHQVSRGIAAFSIRESAAGPQIQVDGVEGGYFPGDWGSAPVSFLVSGPEQSKASAFSATFNLGGRSLFLAGNINKGLIIIAIYAQSDSDKVPSLFVREFYYKK